MGTMEADKFSPDKLAEKIRLYSDFNKYHPIQIETRDKSDNKGFMEWIVANADHSEVHALGGSAAPEGMRRYRIEKTPSEVLHMSHTGIACGIKVVIYPLSKWNEWHTWPGGYIEGFIRMDSDTEEHSEYFVWCYLKMGKLLQLLEEWSTKLEVLEDLTKW
jgi:hypothetical protein